MVINIRNQTEYYRTFIPKFARGLRKGVNEIIISREYKSEKTGVAYWLESEFIVGWGLKHKSTS